MKIKKSLIRLLVKSRQVNYLKQKNKLYHKVQNGPSYKIQKFGNKNKSKKFYVIKRIKGGGLFSNLLFVLNHLIISEELNMIPVVDMENFTNLYSEKKKIDGTKNSWLYYFEPVSKYKLKEVYKSYFVVFSDEKTFKGQYLSYKENIKDLTYVFKKYIKVKKKFLIIANKFAKENNIGSNSLGVHWRGTDHKVLPDHPLPPTKKQILNLTKKYLDLFKLKNIFLVTEQKKYLNYMSKEFDNLFYCNSFRSDVSKDFSNYNRKNHKYNLGLESLIEVLLLSKTKLLICSRSNISEAAVLISNQKLKIVEINNGFNSSSLFYSLFKWKIKQFIPKFLGGFE